MFNLKKNSVVYIACPPNIVSGGPELLHQLCYCLNRHGIRAKMYYITIQNEFYPHAKAPVEFVRYQTETAEQIEDLERNVLIVPEALLFVFDRVEKVQKCIWWLGINHYLLKSELHQHPNMRIAYHYLLKILGAKHPLTFGAMKKSKILHFAQCWYAVSFLSQKGLHNIAYLSDYINDDFIRVAQREEQTPKENVVLYNPKRNTKYVRDIQKAAPELKFVPIQNMSHQEVIDLMCRSKVYVDFGSHPGKDRMPREAALCGCCIFTSFLGSANFYDDVPLSSDFKFERTKKNIPAVIEKIKGVFSNYEEERKQFDAYREFIKSEKDQFEKSVEKLFVLSE